MPTTFGGEPYFKLKPG
ncbi:hypothetical protein [Staphylococcus aureus]